MIDALRCCFAIDTLMYLFIMIIPKLSILIGSFSNSLAINLLLLPLFTGSVRSSIACSIAAILRLNVFSMTCKTASVTICLIVSTNIACFPWSASLGWLFLCSYCHTMMTSKVALIPIDETKMLLSLLIEVSV